MSIFIKQYQHNAELPSFLRIKGYTQRAVPSAEWKTLKKLPKKERQQKLTEFMSSPTPQHPEMSPDEYD